MILLTGFKPFAGRDRNGSETLARGLGGTVIHGELVVSEILDVQWGEPERQLSGWLDNYKPVLLLGLGEGTGDSLRFERCAMNRAAGIDEAGNEPPFGSVLKPEESPELISAMRFEPSWVENLGLAIESNDAGSFLCNAWLYEAISIATCPAAFVHLPVQGDVSDAAYIAAWSPAIREILERNLEA